MMKYTVKLYYSSFCTYEVEAENEKQALKIATTMKIDNNEIMQNLQDWDEPTEIEMYEE